MLPVTKFLGTASVFAFMDPPNSSDNERIKIETEVLSEINGLVSAVITISGEGKHEVDIKAFNAKGDFDRKQIDLSGKRTEKIQLKLNVVDMDKPYVAVISVDKNQDLRREIVGSFINASFSDID